MSTRSLVLVSLLVFLTGFEAAHAGNVVYSKTLWGGRPVHVVSVNLNSPDLKVTVSLAKNGAGSSETFSSMVHRLKPTAAITGTFFCTKSLLPTGDIVIGGERVYTGCIGTGVCITPRNEIKFVPYSAGHRMKWEGYETVLCAGPTLVRDGKLFLCPRDQGFRDPALFGSKTRTAVGATASNKLLMVSVNSPVQLRTLAKIMMSLGAVNAAALDGGTSSALHCNGRSFSRPGRRLTNLLVVYDGLTDYYRHRAALAPGISRTVASTSPSTSSLISSAVASDKPFISLVLPAMYEMGVSGEKYMEDLGETVTNPASPGQSVPAVESVRTAEPVLESPAALSSKPTRRSIRDYAILSAGSGIR